MTFENNVNTFVKYQSIFCNSFCQNEAKDRHLFETLFLPLSKIRNGLLSEGQLVCR